MEVEQNLRMNELMVVLVDWDVESIILTTKILCFLDMVARLLVRQEWGVNSLHLSSFYNVNLHSKNMQNAKQELTNEPIQANSSI